MRGKDILQKNGIFLDDFEFQHDNGKRYYVDYWPYVDIYGRSLWDYDITDGQGNSCYQEVVRNAEEESALLEYCLDLIAEYEQVKEIMI